MRLKADHQYMIRNTARAIVLGACCLGIFAAAMPASDSKNHGVGEAGTTLYLLTADGVIHEGVFHAFADGFFILTQPEAKRELFFAPEVIEGIFRHRQEAEVAKNDPTWAQNRLGLEPPIDESHMSAILRAEDKTGRRQPPPGGSALEENFFSQPPAEDGEKAFQLCIEQAKNVAKNYRQQSMKILGKRSAELAPMLSGMAEEPRLLFDPELYRPIVLNAALTREILAVLQETITRVGLRDKMRLWREMRDIREKWDRFWRRHEGILGASDLAAEEKEVAKSRIQTLRANMGLEPPLLRPPPWEERRALEKKTASE